MEVLTVFAFLKKLQFWKGIIITTCKNILKFETESRSTSKYSDMNINEAITYVSAFFKPQIMQHLWTKKDYLGLIFCILLKRSSAPFDLNI